MIIKLQFGTHAFNAPPMARGNAYMHSSHTMHPTYDDDDENRNTRFIQLCGLCAKNLAMAMNAFKFTWPKVGPKL